MGTTSTNEFEYNESEEGGNDKIQNYVTVSKESAKATTKSLFSFGLNWPDDIHPKYAHLKEEVLKNKYAPITEKTWNGILKKCNKILKGEFSSKTKNERAKLLRDNKVGIKHLVALKLYTDFDLLQREFRRTYRRPYNKSNERLQEFYHWREALKEAVAKFSVIGLNKQPSTLFHGINCVMPIDQYKEIYYGPCSASSCMHVARSFAGKNGMILVINPETDTNKTGYKVLDISWISDYPDEREYLLFDHKIEIEAKILSSDYDKYYHFCHNKYEKKKENDWNLVIGHDDKEEAEWYRSF